MSWLDFLTLLFPRVGGCQPSRSRRRIRGHHDRRPSRRDRSRVCEDDLHGARLPLDAGDGVGRVKR